MFANDKRPRLLVPALAPLYDKGLELAYPFIRIVTGLMLVPHGVGKFTNAQTVTTVTGLLHKLGLEPATPLFWFLASLEAFGGLLVAIGLFTRPVAFVIFVEMMVISFAVYWPNGYFAGARGYEHTLLWGLMFLAIAMVGGGRYSVDRRLGKEL